MTHPKRPWREPSTEEPFYPPRQRTHTQWLEPAPEQRHMIVRNPHKILEAKPKMQADSTSHHIHPRLRGPVSDPQHICTFPRFKKIKIQAPLQAHEKA